MRLQPRNRAKPVNVLRPLAAAATVFALWVGALFAEQPHSSEEEAAILRALGPRVNVEINPTENAQHLNHNSRAQPQAFPEVYWNVASQGFDGAIVQLSCGPFVHARNSGAQVDSQLNLRLIQSNQWANWSVAIATDRTDVKRQDRQAAVAAVSSARGEGQFGLSVTFLDDGIPLEGDYQTTVVGTIIPK